MSVALGAGNLLVVEENQGSQCTEPEANLQKSLLVMNQVCTINSHEFFPVGNILSMQCLLL